MKKGVQKPAISDEEVRREPKAHLLERIKKSVGFVMAQTLII